MARLPVRLREQQHKLPEEGRIRFGIRDETRRGAPKAIQWFRFTSVHRGAIDQLAGLYGGKVSAWQNGYGRPAWQVTTQTSEIRVVLPPDPLTQHYERWRGGGCERRCDGETCTIPRGMGGPDPEPQDVDCLCLAEGTLSCTPKSRLSVVLPDLDPFAGVWRLEAGGDHARQELPAMVAAVREAQGRGMSYGVLRLERRSEYGWNERTGKRELHHFVTPTVGVAASFDALLAGEARAQSLGAGTRLALGAGVIEQFHPEAPLMDGPFDPDHDEPDDDIVDAEIVEDAMSDLDAEDATAEPSRPGDEGPGDTTSNTPGPDPDEVIVEDEKRTLRQRIAMDLGNDDVRHALARQVSHGRTDSTRQLNLEELRLLAKRAQRVREGKVRVTLVDGEAKVERT